MTSPRHRPHPTLRGAGGRALLGGAALALSSLHAVAAAAPPSASPLGSQLAAPRDTEQPGDGPVDVRWEIEPPAPYAGEVFAAVAVISLDAGWAADSLVQLFPQPLDVPLQLEGFAATRGALEWLSPAGLDPGGGDARLDARASLATLAIEGRVRAAVRTAPGEGAVRLEVRRLARSPRPGEVTLAAPRVSYSAATSFRDDLLRGRVPVDPVAGEATGAPLTLGVRAIPEEDRPPAFSGAVGDFGLRADRPAPGGGVVAGEPFAVTVTLTHDRALAPGIRPALVEVDEGLAVLGSAVAATRLRGSGRGAGETDFRFSLSAREAGALALPSAVLVAFDPAAAAFRRHVAELGAVRALPSRAPEPKQASESGLEGEASDGEQRPELPHIGGDADDLRWTLGVLAALFALAVLSVVRRRLASDRVRGPLRRAHVAVFGSAPLHASNGRAVAARGLVRRLRARGLRVSYVEPDDDLAALPAPPTLCHALDAGDAATRARDCADGFAARLVVTATADDVRALVEGDAGVRSNLSRADAVTALAGGDVEALADAGIAAIRIGPAVDVELIDLANGHADEAALRERVGAARDDAEVAVMLGSPGPAGEHGVALDAFAALARRRAPEAGRWHLAIVGEESDAEDAAALRARADELPNVTVLSAIPHGEALVALAAAGALVEVGQGAGEPHAILEAQALGVPVVALRARGAAALVEDGVTGRLFDDARGLADALELLLADRGGARRLAEAARAAAEARGSVAEELGAYIEVYESALASERPTAANAGENER